MQGFWFAVALLLLAGGAYSGGPIRSKRLIGAAPPNKLINPYPFFITVYNRISNGQWKVECSGVLYNNDNVITPAHCLIGDNTNRIVQCGTVQLRKVSKIVKHPNYNTTGLHPYLSNDIAVLEMRSPFVLSLLFQCWPATFPYDIQESFAGYPASVVGWAFYRGEWRLTEANNFRVMSEEQCHQTTLGQYVGEDNICALDPTNAQAVCKGDAGAPLVVGIPRDTVVGFVTWISEKCINGDYSNPGVFTRITSYLNWVRQVVTTGNPNVPDDIMPTVLPDS